MNFYRNFLFALAFIQMLNGNTQSVFQASWQQTVNYNIDVTLDDAKHFLRGFETIEYFNNSPDTLREIYMHLWPNAYKSTTSAFAHNFLKEGNKQFQFSKDEQKGYIDSLDFFIDGKSAVWAFDPANPDIAKITLNKALLSGQKCVISTPFLVKIPDVFSRFGHSGNTYNITQWYAKPAVYDANGWNAMPYLNQGEFYSEFGKFTVNITIPKNYVVASTGVLNDKYEVLFRNMKGKNTGVIENTYCKTPMKTLRFEQNNIHDFAWFASKNFGIRYSNIEIGGKTIDTYIFSEDFKDLTFENMESVKKAILYYSEKIGNYPYEHVTVVKSKLKAGGGMEYPMITVCDILNEEIIIHEVGHNWFYGIFGSNERRYPWMDESINSYFTEKTITDYRKKRHITVKNSILNDINTIITNIMAINSIRENTSQAVNLHASDYTTENYGAVVYGKGAYIFKHLADYLGEEVYFNCCRKFFEQWGYKHPLPGDMQKLFEKESGKNLDWFFKNILSNTAEMDFKIKNIKTIYPNSQILLKKGSYADVPVPLTFYKDKEKLCKIWVTKADTVIKHDSISDFTHVIIDEEKNIMESNCRNNAYVVRPIFKHIYQPKILLGSRLDFTHKSEYYALPLIGFNIHNGFMIGAALHNWTYPHRRFEYWISPFYSFRTKTFDGYYNFNYRILTKNTFQSIVVGFKNASFAYVPAVSLETFKFHRNKVFVKFNFKPKKLTNTTRSTLLVEFNNIKSEWLEKASETHDSIRKKAYFINSTRDIKYQTLKFTYTFENKKTINPYSLKLMLEAGKYKNHDTGFLKPGIEFNYFKSYKAKKKGFAIRFFTGTFIAKKGFDNGLFMYRIGSKDGSFDYNFDNVLAGRKASAGVWSRHVLQGDDNMKLLGTLGNFTNAFATLNLSTTIPGKIPVRLYSDFCIMTDTLFYKKNNSPQKFIFSGGVAIDVIPDIFIIYIPLFQSTELSDISNFGERICFTLKLNELEPHKLIKKINLF